MNRPTFVFRPSMRKSDDIKAWELLAQQKSGGKTDYLVKAILNYEKQPSMISAEQIENIVRQVLKEELKSIELAEKSSIAKDNVNTSFVEELKLSEQEKGDVPQEMMSFLNDLIKDD